MPLLPARVVEARAEGRYRLLVVDGPPGEHRPGQYVFLGARRDAAVNPYAIAGEARPLQFLIRPEPGVADELIAVGLGTIYMSEPRGPGFLPVDAAQVVMFAAGSGIAPIHAQVEHLARGPGPAMTLYYGETGSADFAFRDRMAGIPGLRVVWTVSADEPGWTGARGWVQDVAAADAAGWDPGSTVIYACGMPAMEAAVRQLAARHGLAADRVLTNL